MAVILPINEYERLRDSILAATAEVHRLTLITRNIQDIQRTGIRCFNPFDSTYAAK